MHITSLCGTSHTYSEESAKQTARELVLLMQRKADTIRVRETSLIISRTDDGEHTFKAQTAGHVETVEYDRLWRMADFYAHSTLEPDDVVVAALADLKPV